MLKTHVWRNRIIGSGELPASDFLANPHNWRIHPKPQQAAMAGALDEIGWIQDVIVNQRTGNLIDGHLRVTLALRRGDDTPVPVKYVDLDEHEERLALITLDPLSAMAVADTDKLAELLAGLEMGNEALQAMLTELAEHDTGGTSRSWGLDEIDLDLLPDRPAWCLIAIDMAALPNVRQQIEDLSHVDGVRVEFSAG